ncbi:MAG: HAD family hydrolase [Ruminococcaceae bacterium]|nr:HAD family hydrolase [Oscillospiraceae bacterium]
MKYKYIFWDWNGTVLDDLDASLCAVNGLLEIYGKPPIGLDAYYSYIDTPISKFYEHLFDLNEVTMEAIKPIFGELYARFDDKIILSNGAMTTLLFCQNNGIKQYILSAAHKDDIYYYADRLGITDIFDKIEGASDYDAGSKIERAKRLIAEERIAPKDCLMVGDTLHDLETANAIGMDCVLYSGGHTDYEKLKTTGKTVCSSFEEIRKYIMG